MRRWLNIVVVMVAFTALVGPIAWWKRGGNARSRRIPTGTEGPILKAPDAPAQKPGQVNLPSELTHVSRESSESKRPAEPATNDQAGPDHGELLWLPPKSGQPIAFSDCPQGSQILIFFRPADWSLTRQWTLIARALGPAWENRVTEFESVTQIPFRDVEEAVISIRPTDSTRIESTVTLKLKEGGEIPAPWHGLAPPAIVPRSQQEQTTPDGSALEKYSVLVRSYAPLCAVLGSEQVLQELLANRGRPPALRRDLERLREESAAMNHATILFVPGFLIREGRELLPPAWLPLADFVEQSLGAHTRGAMLSFFIDDREAFAELRVIPTREEMARLRKELPTSLKALSTAVETISTGTSTVEAFWQPLQRRLGTMCQFAWRFLRVNEERGQVIANLSLPSEAAHNLLLGTDLQLRSRQISVASRPTDPTPARKWQRILELPISYSVDQQSLQIVVADVADLVAERMGTGQVLTIEIDGVELERMGITRNQPITRFAVEQMPLREVLTRLVRQANPRPAVLDPSDPRQVLVWTLEPPDNSEEMPVIRITTRAAVLKNEGALPEAFRPK